MCSRQRHRSGCWAFIQFDRVTLYCWLHAESAEKGLDRVPNNYFTYFSTKTYVVGTQKNRLNETVLFSTQNVSLNLWVRKYLHFYAQKFLFI